MKERYCKGEWLGIARCFRPKKGRDFVLVNDRGNMVLCTLLDWSAKTWLIGQYRGHPRHTMKRLSRARWRPAWRIRLQHCSRYINAHCDAVALGDAALLAAVELADRKNGPLPPPLTDEQIRAIPRIVNRRP
ncbi:hypothetical protein [Reyranella sp.]|uniref:hypothetical protein n=1 Tax=Reyranella sp. TaxID=1929291 RepID=UPI003D0C5EFB